MMTAMEYKISNLNMFIARLLLWIFIAVPCGSVMILFGVLEIYPFQYNDITDLFFATIKILFGLIFIVPWGYILLTTAVYVILKDDHIVVKYLFKKENQDWDNIRQVYFGLLKRVSDSGSSNYSHDMLYIERNDNKLIQVKVSSSTVHQILSFFARTEKEHFLKPDIETERDPFSELDIEKIEDEFESLMDKEPSVHYDFVHEKLRSICFMDSRSSFEDIMMNEEMRGQYMDALLGDLYHEHFTDASNSVSYDEIEFTVDKIHGMNTIFIKMPEPEEWCEAFFIALVFKKNDPALKGGYSTEVLYYTLEKGRVGSSTVLCRWDNDKHLNLGEGPEPDLEKFKKSINKIIKCELK